MTRSKIEDEDVVELYNLAWSQFKEDREAIMGLYNELKAHVQENKERYAINGDTLAKYAELLTKQTGQVVELLKITQAQKEKDEEDMTPEEIEYIAKEIKEG